MKFREILNLLMRNFFGHKDPFDRMIIWQAINNGLPLISKDSSLSLYSDYGLKIIW
jgi:PIN domain nuclease of toxin-antitoxin system